MLQVYKQLHLEAHVYCPYSLYKSGTRQETYAALKLGVWRSLKRVLFIHREVLRRPTKDNMVIQEIKRTESFHSIQANKIALRGELPDTNYGCLLVEGNSKNKKKKNKGKTGNKNKLPGRITGK